MLFFSALRNVLVGCVVHHLHDMLQDMLLRESGFGRYMAQKMKHTPDPRSLLTNQTNHQAPITNTGTVH